MGMSIEQIIKYLPAPICGSTFVGKEKQKEYDAHDLAIIIMRKYQQIEQIIQNTSITDSSNAYAIAFIDIKRVVEDGECK